MEVVTEVHYKSYKKIALYMDQKEMTNSQYAKIMKNLDGKTMQGLLACMIWQAT